VSVLKVSLGQQSYDILIGSGTLPELGESCAAAGLKGRVAVITNPVVSELYADAVVTSLTNSGNSVAVIHIPDGEQFKNAHTLNGVYDQLIEAGLDRNSYIVALGGGVVGDLAGFSAATYLRGIPYVQVPTTLLAQVDSSVGGKTAIDHPRGKNLIGAFYQPWLVMIDVETLLTLPEREFRAGLAEVVKYGVALDAGFFEYLEQHVSAINARERSVLEQIAGRCCDIKARIVEQDEKESGLRAVLNYGHTLGHALETSAGYGELVHGEAVAIGMALAARISMQLGHCSQADLDRINGLLKILGLDLGLPAVERRQMVAALQTDKKSRNGSISFICNRGIGSFAMEKLSIEQMFTQSGLEV